MRGQLFRAHCVARLREVSAAIGHGADSARHRALLHVEPNVEKLQQSLQALEEELRLGQAKKWARNWD